MQHILEALASVKEALNAVLTIIQDSSDVDARVRVSRILSRAVEVVDTTSACVGQRQQRKLYRLVTAEITCIILADSYEEATMLLQQGILGTRLGAEVICGGAGLTQEYSLDDKGLIGVTRN